MKTELKEINPMEGLGILKFGMKRDEVRAILGDPTEIDTHSFAGGGEDLSESWHYDDLEVSMSFDEDDDYRLITLAVSSDFYEFKGKSLIGLNRKALTKELHDAGVEDLDFEDGAGMDMPEHDLLAAPSLFVNFWLENGTLKEIQWSPRFTDEDEVEWPE